MLRSRKKRAAQSLAPPAGVAARDFIDGQAPGAALVASIAIAVLLNVIWLWLADLTGSFYHWFSLLQGPLIGLSVRRAGRGVDWRFPALAAVVTFVAAFSGNFLVSLSTTSAVLEVGPLQVLRGLTLWTWQTWYAEVLGATDFIYALFAACVAAFYSRRPLQRQEILALRSMQQESRPWHKK